MTTIGRTVLAAGLAFLLGAALPALIVWNPVGWEWADHLVGREHGHGGPPPAAGDERQLWSCGMHPQVVSEEPGNCPICGMRLTPMSAGPATAAESDKKVLYWRAPMDPSYVSDKPGKSPMGMDLIPVYEEGASIESGVRVDPNFLQNFAVRTAVVERGTIPDRDSHHWRAGAQRTIRRLGQRKVRRLDRESVRRQCRRARRTRRAVVRDL